MSHVCKDRLEPIESPIDEDVEEILDSETADDREKKAKSQWSALEAIVGSDTRLKEVAKTSFII